MTSVVVSTATGKGFLQRGPEVDCVDTDRARIAELRSESCVPVPTATLVIDRWVGSGRRGDDRLAVQTVNLALTGDEGE